MHARGIRFYVADVYAPVAEFSRRIGLYDLIEDSQRYRSTDAAVRSIESGTGLH